MFYSFHELAYAVIQDRRREAAAHRLAPTTKRPGMALVAALLAIVVAVSACGGAEPAAESPISQEQAMEIADNALTGFNHGDYEAWARDWSDTMRKAIDEEAFLGFRSEYYAGLGDYVSIDNAVGGPGAQAGYYRWTFDVSFEKADYRVWFGFKDGSPLIEGVTFVDPAAS